MRAALAAQPLCREQLIERDGQGRTRARCVIGALLHAAGVSDVAIARLDAVGDGGEEGVIWRRYGGLLQREYGLSDQFQLADLMNANDDEEADDARQASVMRTVECLAVGGDARALRPRRW